MRWEDERYVKLYTRDTPEWAMLSWQAKGLFYELLRKCDRAGMLAVGRHGLKALAPVLRAEWSDLEPFVSELVADGCLVLQGSTLIVRNYIEAQEARATPAARKRAEREAVRDGAHMSTESLNVAVTPSHTMSHEVTPSHTMSHEVTIQPISSQLNPSHDLERRRQEESGDVAFLRRYAELTAKDLRPTEAESRTLAAEVARLGLERAVTECHAAARQSVTRNRRWPGVKYLLTVMANLAPGDADALGEVEASLMEPPEWATVKRQMAQFLSAPAFARVIAPLRASRSGSVLLLGGPETAVLGAKDYEEELTGSLRHAAPGLILSFGTVLQRTESPVAASEDGG